MSRFGAFSTIIFLGLLLIAATCERPLDLDIPEPDPGLVVISNFTNNQAVEVLVSKTKSIIDPEATQYVENANVEIFQDEVFLETLDFIPTVGKAAPYYTTRQLVPEVNVTYTIKVEAEGFEPVMATSMIPQVIDIKEFIVSDVNVT